MIPKDQMTIEGASVTEAQKIAVLQEQVPDLLTRCPFCLRSQNLRQMALFNEDGKLLKNKRCVYERGRKLVQDAKEIDRCPKTGTMSNSSATVFLMTAKDFGKWIGTYPYFWRIVDHDDWLASLKLLAKNKVIDMSEFWDGYAEVRPEFQRRRDEEKAAREYDQAVGFKQ